VFEERKNVKGECCNVALRGCVVDSFVKALRENGEDALWLEEECWFRDASAPSQKKQASARMLCVDSRHEITLAKGSRMLAKPST
jgi:hypothetical protein